MRIAIVGSGIAGNVAAHRLHSAHDITVYEAGSHVGGHSHTQTVEAGGREISVDTGFIVYNERTYPGFSRLLHTLGVESQESSMSFSVRVEASGLEYNGTSLDALFAQRRNLVSPSFLGMVRDILRFNREAPRLIEAGGEEIALGDYLARGRYGRAFVDHYLVPMGAAIWSTDPASMLAFPARFFVRFFHNHGMLTVDERPVWRTVRGGSARYVEKLTAPFRHRIRLETPVEWVRRLPGCVMVKARGHEPAAYDAVFLACHSDQSLRLLADPDPAERQVLAAIPYQRNEAVLHTDTRLMPRKRKAWAAWNYHVLESNPGSHAWGLTPVFEPIALTYNMNILQRLEADPPLLVTLNRTGAIDPARILKRIEYHHPLFTPASVAAQERVPQINGARRTWFCGAWCANGFHEDGLQSAMRAVDDFEARHAERALHRTA